MSDGLPPDAAERLDSFLELLRSDPSAPISRQSVAEARDVHIADSLSGVELDELREATRIADIGSGAGLPGIVIAVALPDSGVDLLEASRRKCDFLRRAIERAGAANATAICERAETWSADDGRESNGRERYEAVTARAVGRLSSLAELASPLLAPGGILAAWKGSRDPDEEAEMERALPELAMELVEVRPVTPYPGSRDRHIHLLRKNGPTPDALPRRPGLAAKRPFGSESTGNQPRS